MVCHRTENWTPSNVSWTLQHILHTTLKGVCELLPSQRGYLTPQHTPQCWSKMQTCNEKFRFRFNFHSNDRLVNQLMGAPGVTLISCVWPLNRDPEARVSIDQELFALGFLDPSSPSNPLKSGLDESLPPRALSTIDHTEKNQNSSADFKAVFHSSQTICDQYSGRVSRFRGMIPNFPVA